MSIAHRCIREMRAVLAMPPRDETIWVRMTLTQRRGVLLAAGLPEPWNTRRWQAMTLEERRKIMDQVHEFGRMVDYLQGPA